MEVDGRDGEAAALAAQVLEIIGGGGGRMALEARPSPEEAEDREGWSLEEGDDSVFYSDEDPTHPDAKASKAERGGFRRLVTSEVGDDLSDPQKEEMKEGDEHQREKQEREELRADPGDNAQQQALLDGSSQRGSLATAVVKEEEEEEEEDTQSPPPFDVHNEGGSARPPEPGRDPGVGYHTLPLPKKAGRQGAFDHLTGAKYSTVSYRRIRRGNTRKKIEDFEYMIMNL